MKRSDEKCWETSFVLYLFLLVELSAEPAKSCFLRSLRFAIASASGSLPLVPEASGDVAVEELEEPSAMVEFEGPEVFTNRCGCDTGCDGYEFAEIA